MINEDGILIKANYIRECKMKNNFVVDNSVLLFVLSGRVVHFEL
jgi:hypothetical protein